MISVDKLVCQLGLEDVVDDFLVIAGQRLEALDVIWIGDKPDVDHYVGLAGNAVLEAERSDVDIELIALASEEYASHSHIEIGNLHGAGIDDIIGLLAHALQSCALIFNYRLVDLAGRERMMSPRLIESSDQGWC